MTSNDRPVSTVCFWHSMVYLAPADLSSKGVGSGEGMPEGQLCHFMKGLLEATSVGGKMNGKFRTWLNGMICVTITLKAIFLGKKKQTPEGVWYDAIPS